MMSPSWTSQKDEALETADGSDHGPTKEESCEATKIDDLKGDWLKINQIETSCRESVSHGDGNWRTAQQPWSIDEHSLSLEDLDTPMDSPDNAEYLDSLLAWLTDEHIYQGEVPESADDISSPMLLFSAPEEPTAEEMVQYISSSDQAAYLGKTTGNAPDSGNDRPNFWECPSPYPPNFGSESASDAALLDAPPSPCLSPFDCASDAALLKAPPSPCLSPFDCTSDAALLKAPPSPCLSPFDCTSDAALLKAPPSPCLSLFDCAGSSLSEASQS